MQDLISHDQASETGLLLVHGGWSGGWIWERLIGELAGLGVPAQALDLPGCAHKKSFAWHFGLQDYVDAILHAARDFTRPPILLGHSAGGIAVSQAAARAPHSFAALIYLSAYLPQNGESLASLSALDEAANLKSVIKPDFLHGSLHQTEEAITAASYHDCDPQWVAQNIHRHRPEPLRPGAARVRLSDEFNMLRKVYIRCSQDRAISPAFQDWMIGRYNLQLVYSLATGHMPMIAAPEQLAALLAATTIAVNESEGV